ncbi:MAG: glutamine--fructose-6-phosphate transaminase (isomerizing) [Bdellovibrionales bacterium]|nr:glutamine--fructose-6-phosphate transaminase (isomerizing) [Bdellovibrionales bacterium]
MCGIVGYYGPQNPKDIIVNGLKCLEYRGYDSAGVAIFNKGEFKRVRAEGKLSVLQGKLESEEFDGHIGIGHTRWATHGAPVERNAHPHTVAGVSIVHNGIIENYMQLREDLGEGTKFESETDSELVAHYIAQELKSEPSLLSAVLKVLPKLHGAYSILVVSKDHPDEMVAFKNGPPLIVGVAAGAIIIASDIQAIMPHTKKAVYLDDLEVVQVKGESFKIFNSKGVPVDKAVTTVDWTTDQAQKDGYPHFMLKEIYEQPRAVAKAIAPHINTSTHEVALKDVGLPDAYWATVERVFIVACGTSFYAGSVGKYLIEELARVPVEIDVASEFRYRNPVVPKNSLAIIISQSGETADTLAALRQLKQMGVTCVSICNVKNSTIDRETNGHLYMNSGVEIGVASTKAFTSTLAILNLVALQMAKAKKVLTSENEHLYAKALLAAPAQMETVLACDKFFADAANTLKEYRGFLYMGRGVSYPIALEGALKMKELAYMHAEGYAAGEMKHGPLALIDKRMAVVMLAPSDSLYEKTLSNLEEAKARGGEIISVGTLGNERLKSLSKHYLTLPQANWTINPILEAIPLQLLAYHVASALGNDVDQPRNLAKSVTVE